MEILRVTSPAAGITSAPDSRSTITGVARSRPRVRGSRPIASCSSGWRLATWSSSADARSRRSPNVATSSRSITETAGRVSGAVRGNVSTRPASVTPKATVPEPATRDSHSATAARASAGSMPGASTETSRAPPPARVVNDVGSCQARRSIQKSSCFESADSASAIVPTSAGSGDGRTVPAAMPSSAASAAGGAVRPVAVLSAVTSTSPSDVAMRRPASSAATTVPGGWPDGSEATDAESMTSTCSSPGSPTIQRTEPRLLRRR